MKDSNTIKEARNFIEKNKMKGAKCPCCDRLVKVYKRKISGEACSNLISLYKLDQDDYRHVMKFSNGRSGDFCKLRFWGLIEEMPNEDVSAKRTSGFWRLTVKGRDFVRGDIKVSKFIYLEHGEFIAFVGDLISIREALGNKFNYSELMDS